MNYLRPQPAAYIHAIGAVAFFLVSLVGCGGKLANYPDTAPVTGIVTLDGQPLEGASIAFAPTEGRSSNGNTDAEGNYELRYTGSIKGAMLGNHRVVITKMVPDPNFVAPPVTAPPAGDDVLIDEPTPEMINIIPQRYGGIDSDLTAEVKDTENVINFDLTSE